jgi:hypothetical protein
MAGQPFDTFDIQAQQDAQEEARRKAEARVRLEIDDLKWLMSSKRGRRIMYGNLERAGVYRLSFHTNALQMAFNEGGRNEGLMQLARLMEHCPEMHALMLKERKEDE